MPLCRQQRRKTVGHVNLIADVVLVHDKYFKINSSGSLSPDEVILCGLRTRFGAVTLIADRSRQVLTCRCPFQKAKPDIVCVQHQSSAHYTESSLIKHAWLRHI